MSHLTPIVFVSYPKSGRTWLAVMLGKALCERLGLPDRKIFDLFKGDDQPRRARERVPPMVFSHEGASFDALLAPDALEADVASERGRFVLLVRDPRDALVSHYHQLVGRKRFADERAGKRIGEGASQLTRAAFYARAGIETHASGRASLSSFIRSPMFGVEKIVRFHQVWSAAAQRTAGRMLVIRYEALHEAAVQTLEETLRFIGVDGMTREMVEDAVEFARFDNMRALEAKGALGSGKLKATGRGAAGFKTRKGAVGGHRDELTPADVAFLDDAVRQLGCPFYAEAPV